MFFPILGACFGVGLAAVIATIGAAIYVTSPFLIPESVVRARIMADYHEAAVHFNSVARTKSRLTPGYEVDTNSSHAPYFKEYRLQPNAQGIVPINHPDWAHIGWRETDLPGQILNAWHYVKEGKLQATQAWDPNRPGILGSMKDSIGGAINSSDLPPGGRWEFIGEAYRSQHARYVLRAGFEPRSGYVTSYRANDHGYRGREFPFPSPDADGPRVIFLGDSCFYGWGVNDHEVTAEKFRELIRMRFPACGLEVYNLAVPGYCTEQQYVALLELIGRIRPHVVVLGYVGNDHEPQRTALEHPERLYRYCNRWGIERNKQEVNRRLLTVESGWNLVIGMCGLESDFFTGKVLFRSRLHRSRLDYRDSMLAWDEYAIRQKGGQPGPASEWRKVEESFAALRKIHTLCEEHDARFLLMPLVTFSHHLEQTPFPGNTMFELLLKLADERGFTSLDTRDYFFGKDHSSRCVSELDTHPNAKAHREQAALLVEPVAKLLGLR